jgi:hypothetical protein
VDLDALFEHRLDVVGNEADWSKSVPSGGGVYALTDEQDRLVLLAAGEGLRRAITYRLAPPPEASKKRADLKPVVRRIRWQRTYSPFETAYEFHRIARVLMPGEYLDTCAFGPAWFVHVDLDDRIPQLVPTKYLRGASTEPAMRASALGGRASCTPDGGRDARPPAERAAQASAPSYATAVSAVSSAEAAGQGTANTAVAHGAAPVPSASLTGREVELGPFPTRSAAERFIETLEDLFDLCRYYHILQQAPHGQPCAYFEMGKCPAPCSGRISLDQYRQMMAAAFAFGSGGWRNEVTAWQASMHDLARDQRFEEANRFKQRLQRTELFQGRDYRFVRPIEDFNYLIIQRGEGTSHVRPFFCRAGRIERGQSASRKDLPTAAPAWVDAMRAVPPADPGADPALRSEWVWLVSHYLFKGEAAPGLFLGPEEWPRVDEWLPKANDSVLRPRSPTGLASNASDSELTNEATQRRSGDH